jgi:hypothetical protein
MEDTQVLKDLFRAHKNYEAGWSRKQSLSELSLPLDQGFLPLR